MRRQDQRWKSSLKASHLFITPMASMRSLAPQFSELIGNDGRHRWELPGNCPVFTMVMVIYHYVDIIGEFLLPPQFLYNMYDYQKNNI